MRVSFSFLLLDLYRNKYALSRWMEMVCASSLMALL